MKRLLRVIGPRALRLAILLAVGLAGCEVKTVRSTNATATVGSREVRFSSDGKGGIRGTNKSATVMYDSGEVVVEKDRLLVNGKEVAKLAAEAKIVSVDYAEGTLTITADGSTLHTEKAAK